MHRTGSQRSALLATIALSLAALAAGASAPRAVADPPTAARGADHTTYFSTLFPNPTGENGYEDFIAAGDLLVDDDAFNAAVADNATLAQKRLALVDPNCRRALALIRDGLNKPITLTHAPGADDSAAFHANGPLFPRIGRLLAIEQYVYLADGRTGAAIDSLEDALRVPDVIRDGTLVGGLVGSLTDTINLQPLRDHRAQWSKTDCEHIVQLVRDRLASRPDPAMSTLEAARANTMDAAEKWLDALKQDDWATVASRLEGANGTSVDALRDQWQQVGSDPASQAALWAQIRGRVYARYDQVEGHDGTSPSVPAPDPILASGAPPMPLAATLADLMVDPVQLKRFAERMASDQSALQLLGVEAAVRRYRWEYGGLPASLADVNMPDLTTDPSTSAPFRYKRSADGGGFTLAGGSGGSPSGDTAGATLARADVPPASTAPVLADVPSIAEPGRGSAFTVLFPAPTGRNGYEDLVSAGDALADDTAYQAAVNPEATLTAMQIALADPNLRRSIALVQSGLGKPMRSPRSGAVSAPGAPAPDLALLRRLARLLGAQQYVLLANGRSAGALDLLTNTLHLPDAVRDDSAVAATVAAGIDEFAVNLLACHSGQWSADDCVRIVQFAREQLERHADTSGASTATLREPALLHLLATQAAVYRYRWEYNRLPKQLADLDMPDITTDPYTGAPLQYQADADGGGDTLASARPQDRSEPGGAKGLVTLPSSGVFWR